MRKNIYLLIITLVFSVFTISCSEEAPQDDEPIAARKTAVLSSNLQQLNFPNTYVSSSSSMTIEISNDSQVAASGFQVGIPTSPFQLLGGNCSSEVLVNQTCQVEFSFNPTAVDSYNSTVSFSYFDGLETQSVSIQLIASSQALPVPTVIGISDNLIPQQAVAWSWSCDLDCEYRFVINNNPTHVFDAEVFTDETDYNLNSVDGVFYLHLQARDKQHLTLSTPVTVSAVLDNTSPTAITDLVMDADATETQSTTVHFTPASDETELSHYLIAIGLTAGASDVVNWTSLPLATSLRYSGGTFTNGTDYYTSIQAVDRAGNLSAIVTTAAWMPPGPPSAVTNLSVTATLTEQIDIGWSEPFHNGLVITDYFIYYKESSSTDWLLFNDGVSTDTVATITGLQASTSYDFKVIAFNGSSAADSNIASAETAPENEFFEPNFYRAMNLGGATDSSVVSFDDGATVEHIRSGVILDTYSLNAGETQALTTELNDIVKSDKPLFIAGRKGAANANDRDKGNMVWSTPDWAGKLFTFTGSRYKPHLINVFAFEDAEISVSKGGVEIDSQTVLAEQSYTFSIDDYGGFVISSTGLIVAHMHSSGGGAVTDPRPLLPASNDILGFPSRTMRMTTLQDSNSYTTYHADGHSPTGSMNTGAEISISGRGTGSFYQEYSLRVIADFKVVANSHADANGYCSAPFVPVGMLKKRYAINVDSQYVAFASVEAGDIIMTLPDGTQSTITLLRTDDSPYVPYHARVGAQPMGTRFHSTTRFQAWYEPATNTNAADNDETILFGFDE